MTAARGPGRWVAWTVVTLLLLGLLAVPCFASLFY